MKKLYYAVPLIASLVGMSLFFAPRGNSEGWQGRKVHASVILKLYTTYHFVQSPAGNYWVDDGQVIQYATRSQHAPEINTGDNAAEAIAKCTESGMRLVSDQSGMLVFSTESTGR